MYVERKWSLYNKVLIYIRATSSQLYGRYAHVSFHNTGGVTRLDFLSSLFTSYKDYSALVAPQTFIYFIVFFTASRYLLKMG